MSKVAMLTLLLVAVGGCVRERPPAPPGTAVIIQETQPSWIRNFNPLTPATSPRWPTLAGVYEPLYVFNSVKARYVPWLALSHEWLDDNRRVRIRIRPEVRWSDGEEFNSADVEFTHKLLRKHPGLDRRRLWGFLSDVKAVDSLTVDFYFARVYVPGFDDIVAQQIVPEHHWRDVKDPVAYPNENPVATGPFTEVRVFRNQVFELGRNPYYWQKGKPYLDALRFPIMPSNDRANLALVFDEVDWAANFIPAIDRVFVSRNPEHHDYWFPLTGTTVFLYLNTTKAPFNDVRVRRALSMGINREQLVEIAACNYTRPADATALSDAYVAWRNPEVASDSAWVSYDVAEANRLLDEAGYARGEDGVRRLPNGDRWKFDVFVVSGWYDWVRACQLIARGFADLGIEASAKTYDFSAWFKRVQEGDFDMSIGWSYEGPTPYLFYRWLMSSRTIKPVGEVSMGNWHRYGSGPADSVLAAFEQASDPELQHQLAGDMQRIFVQEAPAIPLYPNPSWAEFNTSRVVGFPTADNPYANPSPNAFDRGETLLVLTNLKPRGD